MVGGKDFLTVQEARRARKAAHLDARAFPGELVGAAQRRETVDRHAGNALQHFGDGGIRQLARLVGDDRVDDGVGLIFAQRRRFQRLAPGGDDDLGYRAVLGFRRCI